MARRRRRAGTGDNMAAALGLGLRPGDVAVSLGTSGTVYTVSETPTADPIGLVAGFADATGRYLPLVCTLNATKVTDAVGRLLDVDRDRFDGLALAAAPVPVACRCCRTSTASGRPTGPGDGVLAGLRCGVERDQLARAAVEGVVCGLLDGLDAFARPAPRPTGACCSSAAAPVAGLPSGRRRPERPGRARAARRRAGRHRRLRPGRRRRHACRPADVADERHLGDGEVVEPGPGAESAEAVRAAYAHLRDSTAPG